MTVALHRDRRGAAPATPTTCSARETDPCDDDAALVLRARGGDRVAEETIYRRHVRYIAAIALRLSARRQDAEDIVQDTFALALSSLDQLREPAALRGWLARIAVSRCQRAIRRRRVLRFVGLDDGADDAPLHTLCAHDAPADVRAELAGVESARARASADERAAWVLHRVNGETLEAVAALCACSLATVKRRVAAAEARIARTLGDVS